MARALRQSLQLRPFSLDSLSASVYKDHSAPSACSKQSFLAQSQAHNNINFPALGAPSGRILSSKPPLSPPLPLFQGRSESTFERRGRGSGATPLGAFPAASSSDELDYASDDEAPSSSGFESVWDDSESAAPRPKTDDWRDMLQAKDRKELRAYAHAQKDSIGLHHVSALLIVTKYWRFETCRLALCRMKRPGNGAESASASLSASDLSNMSRKSNHKVCIFQ